MFTSTEDQDCSREHFLIDLGPGMVDQAILYVLTRIDEHWPAAVVVDQRSDREVGSRTPTFVRGLTEVLVYQTRDVQLASRFFANGGPQVQIQLESPSLALTGQWGAGPLVRQIAHLPFWRHRSGRLEAV